MRWGIRGLVMVAVAAVALPVGSGYAATPEAQDRTRNMSFVDALSAIPKASRELADAKALVPPLLVARAQARAVLDEQVNELGVVTALAHDAALARTRAELVSAEAQRVLDEAAWALYSRGGTVPTLAEVLLTSDSPGGLTESLFTRQYLALGAGAVVRSRDIAEQAVDAAARSSAEVLEQRAEQAARVSAAQATLAAASDDVDSALRDVSDARKFYTALMRLTSVDRSAEYGRIKQCGDWVTKLLSRSGFEGEDLREAWAIVMRESGGREDAISVSNDLGLFQINTATWKGQPWFDRKELLTRKYNAKIGFLLSQGGKSWYSWGLDGHGRPDARAYVKAGWTDEHIMRSIVLPYIAWYQAYPCRPSYEKGYPYALPAPRADERPGPNDQFAGDGRQPGRDAQQSDNGTSQLRTARTTARPAPPR